MSETSYDKSNKIKEISIEKELTKSYIDYAMSVITSRALPDIRDGLKVVHRRILFAMYELSNWHDKPTKKSARVVGDVVGKYHPHGNDAVYEAIVRMAQDFNSRYPLVEGQGNFGSIDGDDPAAMRYTGIRLSKLGELILSDLKYNTVDRIPNYDDTESIPDILPSALPNLLMNGAQGIAVGMATNIPPHNLNEIIEASLVLLKNPNVEMKDLVNSLRGPDFPCGGVICNQEDMLNIYTTGKGNVIVRSKIEIDHEKNIIKVLSLPYQVNKDDLISHIAELVNSKTIEGIVDIVDDSKGMNINISLIFQKKINPDVLINHLFNHTKMSSCFHVNMVALNHGTPQLFNLKDMLQGFLDHRMVVITRRAKHMLEKAKNRLSYLQGLAAVIANIEEIVTNVKKSADKESARNYLLSNYFKIDKLDPVFINLSNELKDDTFKLVDQAGYRFSNSQAVSVLELKIQALTNLEQDKMQNEAIDIVEQAKMYQGLLQSKNVRIELIEKELLEIKEKFGDRRRTELRTISSDLTEVDLISNDEMLISFSKSNYIKAQPIEEYKTQKRGGVGRSMSAFKSGDSILGSCIAFRKNTVLCFVQLNNRLIRVYTIPCYRLPVGDSFYKGKPISHFIPNLKENERIVKIISMPDDKEVESLAFITTKGMFKKTLIDQYRNAKRSNGLLAMNLKEQDSLLEVITLKDEDQILIFSKAGRSIRFSPSKIRNISRSSFGVLTMKSNPQIVSVVKYSPSNPARSYILTVYEDGNGKLNHIDAYSMKKDRRGMGVLASHKSQVIIACALVSLTDEVILISNDANMTKFNISEVSLILSRTGKGSRLMNLKAGSKIVSVEVIQADTDK